jgi:putative DNA methylase
MPTMQNCSARLIETDEFPFEFLSHLGERESWRKEIHRPVYHVHKWWAKRLGSVFRGILLGSVLGPGAALGKEFYRTHSFENVTVLDPFMGSGTTVGEAHKLGFTALGRDINPVAVDAVRVALGPMDRAKIERAFEELSGGVGDKIRALYRTTDSHGLPCDVLYWFWVMQAGCPGCRRPVDLFPSYVMAQNAYPSRKPEVQIVCPSCGAIFRGTYGQRTSVCAGCAHRFDPRTGTAKGPTATCRHCDQRFRIREAVAASDRRPAFRLYGKLVLARSGGKDYLRAGAEDLSAYEECSRRLDQEARCGTVLLPTLTLEDGYNTRQAMGYNFCRWRDFFNDRQLLALGWLRAAIASLSDPPSREALLTLFSGVLEFNNLFASYKGEGTGAVRHMFAHHILKPERTPIEANVWGTPKSSGSFSNLFRGRLLRAIEYRAAPTEVNGRGRAKGVVSSPPFTGKVRPWPVGGVMPPRAIYLSCGDSSDTGLPENSIDLVVTDPPFFDNVHYSELADFFYSWRHLRGEEEGHSTRNAAEVQDSDADRFAAKLQGVLRECRRVLKKDGLLVFTYHHSRDDGWRALISAALGAGFVVVNSHPVKSEMSVAAPKSQAKEPIQLDIILVCRKAAGSDPAQPPSVEKALESAKAKMARLSAAGFNLSRNDRKVILFGQLLTTVEFASAADEIARRVESELASLGLEEMPLFRGH